MRILRPLAILACAVLLLLGLAWLAVDRLGPGLAEDEIRAALVAAGLENTRFRVASTGLHTTVIKNFRTSDDALAADTIIAEYDPADLLDSRLRVLRLEGVRIRMGLRGRSPDLGVLSRLTGGDGPLPFDVLEIADGCLILFAGEAEWIHPLSGTVRPLPATEDAPPGSLAANLHIGDAGGLFNATVRLKGADVTLGLEMEKGALAGSAVQQGLRALPGVPDIAVEGSLARLDLTIHRTPDTYTGRLVLGGAPLLLESAAAGSPIRSSIKRVEITGALSTATPLRFSGEARLEANHLAWPARRVEMKDIRVTLPFSYSDARETPSAAATPDEDASSRDLAVQSLRVGDVTVENLSGRLAYDNGLVASLRVPLPMLGMTDAGDPPAASLSFRGTLRRDGPRGRLTASLPRFAIQDNPTLVEAIPILAPYALSGHVWAEVRIDLDGATIAPRFTITADEMNLKSRESNAGLIGISGTVILNGFPPLHTPEAQTLTVRKAFSNALVVTDGEVVFRLDADAVRFSSISARWADGTLRVEELRVPFYASQLTATLRMENLDLESVFAFIYPDSLRARGRLHGYLPVTYRWHPRPNLDFGDGLLEARPEKGWFRILDKRILDALAPVNKVLTTGEQAIKGKDLQEALGDFSYKHFRIRFGDEPGGWMTHLETAGAGPGGPNPIPVKGLDVSVTNMATLLKMLILSKDMVEGSVREALRKQIRASIQQKEVPASEETEKAVDDAVDKYF